MASLCKQTSLLQPCRCTSRLWAGTHSGGDGSSGTSLQPWRRGGPPCSTHRRPRRRPSPALPQAVPEVAVNLLATLSSSTYADPSLAADTFEPQMRPEIVVAAAVAATPPILFWARIFIAAQKRQQAIDAERAAEEQRKQQREELKRKITGQSGEP